MKSAGQGMLPAERNPLMAERSGSSQFSTIRSLDDIRGEAVWHAQGKTRSHPRVVQGQDFTAKIYPRRL